MDVVKLARDPAAALENLIERPDALDTDQLPGKAGAKGQDGEAADPDVAARVRAEMERSQEPEAFDKKVVKQIAYFKAINEHHPEQIQ